MEIEFEGPVELGDEYRGRGSGRAGLIHVGGVDVLEQFELKDITQPVTVVVNDGERIFHGEPNWSLGQCDRDWNPLVADRLDINGSDLLSVLQFYAGESIHLLITDEKSPDNWRES